MLSKYYLLIFNIICVLHLIGQDHLLIPSENYCSHVRMAHKSTFHSTDIDQTPLLFNYDVKFYHLDLNVENNTTFLSGSVTILAEVTSQQLDTFAVELIDEMIIDSIYVNSVIHPFYRESDEVFIPLTETLPQSSNLSVKFYYHGNPPVGGFFSGVNIDYDSLWNKSVVWTLSEPFNARQWWPVKQVLYDKADSVWVFLTTSNENLAGTNGILENVVPLPNNKTRFEWKSNSPIAYYLISYAVADYQDYSIYAKPSQMNGDSILVQNFIYDDPGCLNIYKERIDRTVPMIELFSDLYSLYPFYEEKYGHCLASISGGMEHQTMTTLNDFGLGLVAHELAHMWFGDNVTCATWSDIWVNEGFATYSDYLAHEIIAGDHWPALWMKLAHNYVISEPGGSIYVPPEEVEYDSVLRIFSSRLTYYKGAIMLHMIRYELNDDDLFFQVFKDYQQIFKDSVATSFDFLNVLNETTGKDFNLFFDQWFFGEGYPIYTLDYSINDGILEIHSTQTASKPEATPFFDMRYPLFIYFNDESDTVIHISQKQPLETITVNVSKGVDSIRLDPGNWVLKKVDGINNITSSILKDNIIIVPNPASDFITISGLELSGTDLISIFNNTGTRISKTMAVVGKNKINITHLSSGLYFIQVELPKRKILKKFIKH
ncbi:MAG: T9SS type A sorting domain-containing protein [Bacteroidales bacterium]|nr:T9SS type A sorting domain-containing protein [Bacteroidales bacterium]MCF8403487.1 T9SS type A sorting domain-containing protein [Bacteroidales bacterium]